MAKNLPVMLETQVQSLDQEDPPEKGMSTHSSILAWRIPRTEEPGRLWSRGSQESDVTERLNKHHNLSFGWGQPHAEVPVGKVQAAFQLLLCLWVSALVQNITCHVSACPGSWTQGQPNVVSVMCSAAPALGFQSHQHTGGS